ncbi:MAG: hypothetical protein AB7I42_24850 [Bradyrhizobium sp.]|uniref:hypothetical protein n=1 Tax=Bradyrhizobium sp. TaxID=376 RepID=UPI003D0A52FC
MRKPGGHYFICDETGSQRTRDTFSCAHCNKIVVVKPMCDPADMGGRCYVCDSFICTGCVGKGCDPLEKKLERIEAQARFRRDLAAL